MDLWSFIAHDHANITELLDELTTRSAVDRSKLFLALNNELEAHGQIEKIVFYPALTTAKFNTPDERPHEHQMTVSSS